MKFLSDWYNVLIEKYFRKVEVEENKVVLSFCFKVCVYCYNSIFMKLEEVV